MSMFVVLTLHWCVDQFTGSTLGEHSMASLYSSLQPPPSQYQGAGISKLAMDISSMNVNPFFQSLNSNNSDDIIMLQTTEEPGRQQDPDPDIIPLSFSDTVHGHGQGSYTSHQQKINLIVSEAGEVSDHQYRIIPEMMGDGAFHEAAIDSCLSIFPEQEPSPVKQQEQGKQQQAGQGQPCPQEMALPITGNHTAFQALFEAATSEYTSSGPALHQLPTSSAPSSLPSCSTSTPAPAAARQEAGARVDSKKSNTSPGKSMSQGKLRVINQGIPSENIQSPSLAECRTRARRRSGQASGYSSLGSVPPLCPSASPALLPAPQQQGSRGKGMRLLSVGALEAAQEPEPPGGDSAASETESEPSPASPHDPSLSTPGPVPWPNEELWRGGGQVWTHPDRDNTGWTHPVESVDTAVPASGAVWQLPTSQGAALPGAWSLPQPCGLPEPPALSLIPPPCGPPPSSIPWNTPVTAEVAGLSWSTSSATSTSCSTAGQQAGPRDTPPGLAVSWTQPQTSASPSPAGQPPATTGPTSNPVSTSAPPPSVPQEAGEQGAGPSWRNTFGDDHMLAIRSGIPLALQNKAIRSGVPIGPFQNKRKKKSRASQDGSGRGRKRPSLGGKRGDLEVRKDLTIESQRTQEDLEQVENVFQSDDSRPSTSNIVSRTKEETSVSLELGVSSPIGGVHIKTVKSLNEFSQSPPDMCADLLGESSKAEKLQFSCVNCNMMFVSAGQLKRHTQNTHGKEEVLYCQVCPEKCHGKENLKLHLYKTHGIGELFRCEECNYESPMKASYIKHISEHIPQEDKKKKCPKCEKVFKTKTGLNMHLKQHFDESLFSCLTCDFKTPQKLNLIKHTASKHGQDVDGRMLDMSFICELCDFKCIAEHMLKNHVLRKHTQKAAMRFPCNQCSYATVEKAALDKHVRFKHTNERPFMCDTCGFSTHTNSAMARHKRSHSNAKPHKCEICGHEYADRKRLRDHMYLHNDHKPFKCELCSYTCRRKDNLAAHLKKQHSVSKLETVEERKVDKEERKEEREGEPDSSSSSSFPAPPRSPPSLPTIAMADIAVPFSHSIDIPNGGYADQVLLSILPNNSLLTLLALDRN